MNLLPEDQVDAGQAYDGLGNSEIIDTAFENKIRKQLNILVSL